jgi:hypothetical protein
LIDLGKFLETILLLGRYITTKKVKINRVKHIRNFKPLSSWSKFTALVKIINTKARTMKRQRITNFPAYSDHGKKR